LKRACDGYKAAVVKPLALMIIGFALVLLAAVDMVTGSVITGGCLAVASLLAMAVGLVLNNRDVAPVVEATTP
jgi:hypothetical protein